MPYEQPVHWNSQHLTHPFATNVNHAYEQKLNQVRNDFESETCRAVVAAFTQLDGQLRRGEHAFADHIIPTLKKQCDIALRSTEINAAGKRQYIEPRTFYDLDKILPKTRDGVDIVPELHVGTKHRLYCTLTIREMVVATRVANKHGKTARPDND